MRATAVTVALLGALVGLAAMNTSYGWRDATRWLPDLAVGWTLIGCGTLALAMRSPGRTGWLLVAAGFAWFIPNFASAPGLLGTLAAGAYYLHRGPLLHALLGFPLGRLGTPALRAVVGLGYLAAVAPVLAGSPAMQVVLGIVVIGAGAHGVSTSVGLTRRARQWILPWVVAMGVALIGVTFARYGLRTDEADTVALLAYEVALCAVAVALLVGLVREPWRGAALTDLVVELSDGRPASVREELAEALGDRTLEVGYALEGGDRYVDARGRPVSLPSPGTGRVATPIRLDERMAGVLVHDAAVADDPALLASIAEATRLAASNARLQAEVHTHIEEVEASRRRLVEAEDEERRRIEARLREGTVDRLNEAADSLAQAASLAAESEDGAVAERVADAATQLAATLDDLGDLGRGLHPRMLEDAGLGAALLELAARAHVPVDLSVELVDVGFRLEAAAFFVCSEGIANVQKHAQATRVAIRVASRRNRLVVELEDDGVGGADPSSGSGLRGVQDRVEMLGGTFAVSSVRGKGTRLTAEIPVGGEA